MSTEDRCLAGGWVGISGGPFPGDFGFRARADFVGLWVGDAAGEAAAAGGSAAIGTLSGSAPGA